MQIACSILDVDSKQKIDSLNKTNIDYIHLDVMDGIFVTNKTKDVSEFHYLLKDITKKIDVHLMVKDIKKYIDEYEIFNPEFITFHYEATNNIDKIISYIKNLNIKVGISIKPDTDVSVLLPYLDKIDLVLVMSVEPGHGGQKFIINTINKINKLREINGNYVIEVDGGINDETIRIVDSDISVVGHFITKSDNYQEQIDKL